jgi:chaperonin GroES
MKFKPSFDFIVVSNVEIKQPFTNKLIIPGSAKQKLFIADVQEVGPGTNYKGKVIPMTVHVGDKVLFGKGIGQEIDVYDEKCLLMQEGEIFGILKGYDANN